MLIYTGVCYSIQKYIVVYRDVSQCITACMMYCNVLQYSGMYCNVLQYSGMYYRSEIYSADETSVSTLGDGGSTIYGNVRTLDDEWGTLRQAQRVLSAEV